jgi:hypothetical protein
MKIVFKERRVKRSNRKIKKRCLVRHPSKAKRHRLLRKLKKSIVTLFRKQSGSGGGRKGKKQVRKFRKYLYKIMSLRLKSRKEGKRISIKQTREGGRTRQKQRSRRRRLLQKLRIGAHKTIKGKSTSRITRRRAI